MAGGEAGMKARLWHPGFVAHRWRHVFWICPLTGLLLGLILFFGFLVGQPSHLMALTSMSKGVLPRDEAEAVVAHLQSSEVTSEVAGALVENGWVDWLPEWDLKRRTRVRWWYGNSVLIEARHPDEAIARRIVETFHHRGRYVLDEIRASKAERLESGEREGDGPACWNHGKVEAQACHGMLAELHGEVTVSAGSGIICRFSTTPTPVKPKNWWQRLDPWIQFVGKWFCAGVLVCVPVAYLGEALFPRRG